MFPFSHRWKCCQRRREKRRMKRRTSCLWQRRNIALLLWRRWSLSSLCWWNSLDLRGLKTDAFLQNLTFWSSCVRLVMVVLLSHVHPCVLCVFSDTWLCLRATWQLWQEGKVFHSFSSTSETGSTSGRLVTWSSACVDTTTGWPNTYDNLTHTASLALSVSHTHN